MANYRVEVVMASYRFAKIEVEANSEEEANRLAINKARDVVFSSNSGCDYEELLAQKTELIGHLTKTNAK